MIALALVDLIDRAVAVEVDADVGLAHRVERFAGQGDQRMEPPIRAVLVAPLPAQDRRAVAVIGLAARDRHPELHAVLEAELEERTEAARGKRMLQGSATERGLVVAVEDAGEGLDVEGKVRDQRQLHAFFLQALGTEEIAHDVGTIDPLQIVLVDLVRVAEAITHLPDPGLRAEWQGEQGEVGFGQGDGRSPDLAPPLPLRS
jgi:hypothetical protein